MDFHSLTRRELQALCKKNKIPANMTNVAMADALKALETVEGIEEFLNPSESGMQSSIESPEKSEVTSPALPATGKTTTRRKTVKELETLPPGTRTRHSARKTTDVSETPVTVQRVTRRAQAASARWKLATQFNECEEEEKAEEGQQVVVVTPTPSQAAASRRRGVKNQNGLTSACSTRRSSRLAAKAMEKLNISKEEKLEQELYTKNMAETLEENAEECFDDRGKESVETHEKSYEREVVSGKEMAASAETEGKLVENEKSNTIEVDDVKPNEISEAEDEKLADEVETITGRIEEEKRDIVEVKDEPSTHELTQVEGLEIIMGQLSEMSKCDELEVVSGEEMDASAVNEDKLVEDGECNTFEADDVQPVASEISKAEDEQLADESEIVARRVEEEKIDIADESDISNDIQQDAVAEDAKKDILEPAVEELSSKAAIQKKSEEQNNCEDADVIESFNADANDDIQDETGFFETEVTLDLVEKDHESADGLVKEDDVTKYDPDNAEFNLSNDDLGEKQEIFGAESGNDMLTSAVIGQELPTDEVSIPKTSHDSDSTLVDSDFSEDFTFPEDDEILELNQQKPDEESENAYELIEACDINTNKPPTEQIVATDVPPTSEVNLAPFSGRITSNGAEADPSCILSDKASSDLDSIVQPPSSTPVKKSASKTPLRKSMSKTPTGLIRIASISDDKENVESARKSASKTPTTIRRMKIISDDKENVDSGKKLNLTKEKKKLKKAKNTAGNVDLQNKSLRQLNKMFKELVITNNKSNKNENDNNKAAVTSASRPALQALLHN